MPAASGDADVELRRSDPHSAGHKPRCAKQRQRLDPKQQWRVQPRCAKQQQRLDPEQQRRVARRADGGEARW